MIDIGIDDFAMRLLTDCINEQTAAYWIRRAEQFEAARPHPNEFQGRATPGQQQTRWHELTEIANACRSRATVAPIRDLIDPTVEMVWTEVA